jgi:hypothetical protein
MMKGAIKLELARLRDMTHVEWEYWEADLVPGGFWARMAPDAVIALEAAAAGARLGQVIFQERAHGQRDPLRVRPGQDGTA